MAKVEADWVPACPKCGLLLIDGFCRVCESRLTLKEIKAKKVAVAGSTDELEDHYHVGNVADNPDETPFCQVHECLFVDGKCPKCKS
jgi:DNA-directed RNA polymerase subunit M/transcription elongation factor TFIIS